MSQTSNQKSQKSGCHLSRYFFYAKIPDGNGYAALDLFQGSFAVLTSVELFLLSVVEELDLSHPAMEKFRKFGFVVDFDQEAMLNALGRVGCGHHPDITLTICPTMGCNFDCPYCFEDHRAGKMSQETQEAIVVLADKMLTSFGARSLSVTWFGGEPLLAPDVIDSLSQRLMEMAQRRNVRYSAKMITNGYFLNQENVALLERCCVKKVQITLDGLEEEHNKTRHLSGGQGTFERITANLRENRLPFSVLIRHNVHMENLDQVEKLRSFTEQLAQESGNKLLYKSALVHGNEAMSRRGGSVSPLNAVEEAKKIEIQLEAGRYASHEGLYCSANNIYDVAIDDEGRMYKCWEEVDKPEKCFGHVTTWDPDRPVRSAERLDQLTLFLNTCCPVSDPSCQECLWLPMCCGGCPKRRLDGENVCFAFKDDPDAFALAVYRVLCQKEQARRKPDEQLC